MAPSPPLNLRPDSSRVVLVWYRAGWGPNTSAPRDETTGPTDHTVAVEPMLTGQTVYYKNW